MLAGLFGGVRPQEAAVAVRGRESDRIELVVSHDRAGAAGVHHSPDDVDNRDLPRTAVDQVTEKERLATLWMPIGPVRLTVAQLSEQRPEFAVLAVDVADDVVSHRLFPVT